MNKLKMNALELLKVIDALPSGAELRKTDLGWYAYLDDVDDEREADDFYTLLREVRILENKRNENNGD